MQSIEVIILVHLSESPLFVDLLNLTLHLSVVSLGKIGGILSLLQVRSPYLLPVLLL
jgi:hypothetical protein